MKRRNQNGFFTIWVLVLSLGLFFISGIAVDMWRVFSDRRDLNALADAAADTGTSAVDLTEFNISGNVRLVSHPGGFGDMNSAEGRTCRYLQTQVPGTSCVPTGSAILVGGDLTAEISVSNQNTVQVDLHRRLDFSLMRALPGIAGSEYDHVDDEAHATTKAQCIGPANALCN